MPNELTTPSANASPIDAQDLIYFAETMMQFHIDTAVKAYEAGTGKKIRKVTYEHGKTRIDYEPVHTKRFLPGSL